MGRSWRIKGRDGFLDPFFPYVLGSEGGIRECVYYLLRKKAAMGARKGKVECSERGHGRGEQSIPMGC